MKPLSRLYLRSLLVIGMLLLAVPAVGLAESPEEALSKMLAVAKASRSRASLVSFVDWETAFSRLDPALRTSLGVNSADDFRSQQEKALSDPEGAVREQMNKELAKLPEAEKDALEKSAKLIQDTVREELVKEKERLSTSEYSFGKAVVEGDKAVVPVSINANGLESEERIELIKKGETWLLVVVPSLVAATPEVREEEKRAVVEYR